MKKRLLNCMRLISIAYLLLLGSDGLYGGIQATSAAETTGELPMEVELPKKQIAQTASNSDSKEMDWPSRESIMKTVNLVKRAPSGFAGVRGKKDIDENDMDASTDWSTGIQNSLEERWKKTPTGFYGVRGKKYGDLNEINDNTLSDDQLLEEEEDRKESLQFLIDRLAIATAYLLQQNDMVKRAPQGFNGMRGKRYLNSPSDNDNEIDLERRALNNAFMGVRGKKATGSTFYKRAAYVDQLDFAGRKRFNDFANKFVAVRGKKNSDYNLIERNALNERQRYYLGMLPSLLYSSSPKRAPSGFLGMRGKR